jgi:hypothetical protein
MASTLGVVVGAGLLAGTLSRARATWAEAAHPPVARGGSRRELLRLLLVFFAGTYVLWHLATATFIFDRYLLPLLPAVVLLGLDVAPSDLVRSPVLIACLVVSGLFSVAGTREYLSWNDARDRAVRALLARGVPDTDVDGGFEVDGPRHFEAYLQRTGKLHADSYFWLTNTRYRISFWPTLTPDCTILDLARRW